MKYNKPLIKTISLTLLLTMISQLVLPNVSFALTTGPSQPEVQSFEPVGTTDMVDMFSGSFVYNIPLMDVEGYPINIAYHGGVTMEQEASWVGLGWNINPGAINRTVRGLPDDFNGDTVVRNFSMKAEKTLRVGMGVGVEFAGVGDPLLNVNLDLGANVNISNYRGVSCDFSLGGGVNVFHSVSAGVNLGVGSQSGASIDYNAGLTMSSSQTMSKDIAGGVGVNIGGGYSTRSGVKDLNLSFSVSADNVGFNSTDNIPIGVKNYVPVITNSSTMNSIYGRIKLGGEAFTVYPYGNINAMFTKLQYNDDGSRQGYGYMYLQNAGTDDKSMLDFTRDKDGMFNKSMQYLPVPSMTYDVYSVTGQGTGGTFRPFRNDFGSVYDPVVSSTSTSKGGEVEAGIGDLFEAGLDETTSGTDITSGPWANYQRSGIVNGFTSTSAGSVYENVYFKQGGELTSVDSSYFSVIGGTSPVTPDAVMKFPKTKPNSSSKRDARGTLIYSFTAQEDTLTGIGTNPNIVSYTNTSFTDYGVPQVQNISRIGVGPYQRKKYQISEIQQLQKDGKRYVYAIPAMNNLQCEATFSIDPSNSSNYVDGAGAVHFTSANTSNSNPAGRDNYYNNTVTPSYAHSYLLTSVLSSDYVDITGNGPSDDDLGSYTKFNYTRTDSDFRWVSPYSANFDSAQYNSGFWSDKLDDKGSFVCGSREQWNLHSIETKSFIAEFYTSPRNDAKGIQNPILSTPGTLYSTSKSSASLSYKLDSIKLYNKHDRFINGANATPVKTVFFVYDYSLCPGVPNSSSGKLTLKNIYFRYGNSNKSMASPYQFAYSSFNPIYNLANKDRWGDYKPSNGNFPNYEYPYTDQTDASNDTYASAWSLTAITLPSGGIIQTSYQRNQYAYVQDKTAAEMYLVGGVGNSPSFTANTSLYQDKNSPNLYIYFTRRKTSELSSLTFAQNYFGANFNPGGQNCMYFNFAVRLTGANNTVEAIKGYANITDIGRCSDSTHGYVKLTAVIPTGGGASLNPATYTALNVGRYNLPQILYPGQDPNESDLKNILSGLKESFNELIGIGRNPFIAMLNKGDAQNVDITRSCIRLQSVGLCKRGGGQRVSQLSFFDNWSKLAGGNEQNATYGKNYDYTISDPLYGTISSGVASYEPLIGGDENPLRQPVPYTGQSGSNWPPNDPVDLYQETPLGESLFPPGQVGYSQIKVTSINQSKGRSAQGIDLYQFYTAKDFPAQVVATAINANSTNHFDFFSQKNLLTATQGYTLIFNDMHGKPKRVEHDLYNPVSQTAQPITYQVYNYHQSGGKLNNIVNCVVYNGSNMVVKPTQLGIEEDVTLDTRQKNEDTHNSTLNANLNVFMAWIFPVPVPWKFTWTAEYQNEFQCATVSKVVQQYGILDNVISYNEDAITTVQNELYDPNTGDAIATSVNNEYQDKEYTMNIPAYWVYKGMSPGYFNIGYKDTGIITIGAFNIGTLHTINTAPLDAGDEVAVTYTDNTGQKRNAIAWIGGILPYYWQDTTRHISSTVIYDTTYGTPTPITGHKYCWNGGTVNVYANNASYAPYDPCPDGTMGQSISNCVFGAGATVNIPASCSITGNISVPITATYTVSDSTKCDNTDVLNHAMTYTIPAGTHVTVSLGSSGTTASLIGEYNGVPSGYECWFTGTFTLSDILDTTGWNTPTTITSHTIYDTTYTYSPDSTCGGMSIIPRYPQNTLGWASGDTLKNVMIKVVHSGRSNILNQYAETYTSMDNPISSGVLSTSLTHLVNLKAMTYADSNTRVIHKYIANGDTLNPYVTGERGIWRLQNEYDYIANRNYAGTTTRNSGLFSAASFYAPLALGPWMCSSFPYLYLQLSNSDPNWHLKRSITKYSTSGKEIENIDAVGNYSTAVYTYDESLPVAVASNAQQGEILSEGFEDYKLLQAKNSLINLIYSPFKSFFSSIDLTPASPLYNILHLNNSYSMRIDSNNAHTGKYSLYVPDPVGRPALPVWTFPIPLNTPANYSGMFNPYNIYYRYDPYNIPGNYVFSSANEYMPFTLNMNKTYVVSFWIKPSNATPNSVSYPLPNGTGVIDASTFAILGQATPKSNIIDGWEQVEATFTTNSSAVALGIPFEYYVDDIRVYPAVSNMKSFVYDPVNERLSATLDENNFATFYEYDQEGNLVRTKKETANGIMTISESRSANPKK